MCIDNNVRLTRFSITEGNFHCALIVLQCSLRTLLIFIKISYLAIQKVVPAVRFAGILFCCEFHSMVRKSLITLHLVTREPHIRWRTMSSGKQRMIDKQPLPTKSVRGLSENIDNVLVPLLTWKIIYHPKVFLWRLAPQNQKNIS